MDLPDLPIHELSDRLRRKGISISELLEAVLRRIEEREQKLHAYISLDPEGARARVRQLEKEPRESPLFGIPIAVKDIIAVEGFEATCGSRILKGYHPPYSATAVERLLQEGVIVVGKTNMDEFGMGASGEYSAFGPTRNPHHPEYVPGGSSSGSAAAGASGEAIVALGSDTGGSVRQPAAFTGVVGLKPTYGRISRYGLVAFASSLDQIGTITKDVLDAALLFGSIAGFDPKDSTSFPLAVPTLEEIFEDYKTRRFRIGIPKEYFIEGVDSEVLEAVEGARKTLERAGFPTMEVSLPHTRYSVAVYQILCTSEASSNLARYDGTRYGYRTEGTDDLLMFYMKTRLEGFGDEVKRRILLGTFALSAGYYDAYYLKAQKVRRLIREDFDQAFKEVDLLLTPVSPVPPFKIGEKVQDPLSLYLIDIFSVTANLAGLPGLTLPCGQTREGLPIGFQLIGRPFEEAVLFKVGRFYEEERLLS